MKISRMNLTSACLIMAIVAWSPPLAAPTAKKTGPTIENVLAADRDLAKALQNNDSVGIYHLLDKDWAVIPSDGSVHEGPEVFPSGIRTGYRTLRVMEL